MGRAIRGLAHGWGGRVALFLSNAVNRVDRKGRMSVPSGFRSTVQDAGFERIALYPAIGVPCLEGADPSHFELIARRIYEKGPALSPKMAGLARRVLGQVVELSWDSEGRVVLPQHLKDYCGITTEAKVIGMGPIFQIWDPARQLEHDLQSEAEHASAVNELGSLFAPEGV